MNKNLYLTIIGLITFFNANAQDLSFAKLPELSNSYNEIDTAGVKVFVNDEKPESITIPEEIMPIATDRPDQTESPYLVPVKMFQIETGYAVEYDKADGQKIKNYTYNTSLLKYGLSRQFELRLIAEYLGTSVATTTPSDKRVDRVNGMNSLTVGTKIFICEERGIIPKTSLLAHLDLPYFGSSTYKAKHLAPRFRFSMQHTLSKRFSFSYNVGGEWDGNSQDATIIYTATIGAALVGNLSMFVESYGFMTENSTAQNEFSGTFLNDHRLDGGFTYLVANNLQLDLSGGVGVSKASPDSFLSCGVSWRFPK